MSVVDEIKQKIDILDLVSQTVKLRKSGRSYAGLCPFHQNTRRPAFYVFPETQTWHCFGACGMGGDIFTFVMKKENVDFGDALECWQSAPASNCTGTLKNLQCQAID